MRSFSSGYGYRFDLGSYFPPAIKAICIACAGVFTLQELSGLLFHAAGSNFWSLWFGLVPVEVTHGFIWQPFTYLFLHGGIWHILLNLLFLCMFGADLERAWGSRRFFGYFCLCGIGAGIIDVAVRELIVTWHWVSPLSLAVPTIGASGAIYGILLAAAMVMPHSRVWFFPLPVTVSMRVFIVAMIAIEFFGTIGSSGDNVSHVCHLGGMLVGYVYLRRRRGSVLYGFRNQLSDWRRRRLRKKFEVYARNHSDKPPTRPDNWVN